MRIRHYFLHSVRRRYPEHFAAVVCNAAKVIEELGTAPHPALGWFSRWIAFLTTPFKFWGISGWQDTGCEAKASGTPVRDAQHSTDGFWTIDVAIAAFEVGGQASPAGRFVRVEVEPGTLAHEVCEGRLINAGEPLRFGGPVVLDTDGVGFLEIHPDRDFSRSGRGRLASEP
jgi:hypothetical protein